MRFSKNAEYKLAHNIKLEDDLEVEKGTRVRIIGQNQTGTYEVEIHENAPGYLQGLHVTNLCKHHLVPCRKSVSLALQKIVSDLKNYSFVPDEEDKRLIHMAALMLMK